MSDDHSEPPPLVPSRLWPTDKSLPSVWEAQREQAKQMVAIIQSGATRVRDMRKLEGKVDALLKTIEEQDKRMDGIERTIAKWGGVVVGLTVAVQLVSLIWTHLNH